MSSWSSEHVFEHPWEEVVRAAFRKYPNPCNPAVSGVDVVDRTVCPKGTIQTHRLLSTEFPLPDVAARLLGASSHGMHISEHSRLDTTQSTFKLQSKNLTLGHLVSVHEHLEYFPHPQDKSKTCLKQKSVVKVNVPFLSGYLEKLLLENFEKNAQKGRNGMEWVMDKIKEEDSNKVKLETSSDILSQIETKFKKEAEDLKQSMDSFLKNAQATGSPL